jgi:hypothetical protein
VNTGKCFWKHGDKFMDKEFESRYKKAVENAERSERDEPRAKSARFDAKTGRVKVELQNGTVFIFPTKLVEGLANADADELKSIDLTPAGDGLRWDVLDVDLSLVGLMMGIFGGRRWMSELGRSGGRSTSDAKKAAARSNGKLGGRPKSKAV